MSKLADLVPKLQQRAGLQSKRDIGLAMETALRNGTPYTGFGDDCAAIPDGEGHLLFAIEGLIQGFVESDPWFAGYSAVMVNLSDIAAMGGRPIAVTDALWARDTERFAAIWEGMQAASDRYGVPIVGGHTNVRSQGDHLAVAVLGRAGPRLLTSFDAKPGDLLMAAIDLRGSYREPNDFWNASSGVDDPARLRDDLEVLPQLAEDGLVHAAKDISMGGLVGTALMLLETSGVGASIDLDAVPSPDEIYLERWLVSFPSYGYVLAVSPDNRATVSQRFGKRDIACQTIGIIQEKPLLQLKYGQESSCFWDLQTQPLMYPSSYHPATIC
ncbi:MAG: sll0787 family AIR synthase-like protein [Planctomycetota bacterium]